MNMEHFENRERAEAYEQNFVWDSDPKVSDEARMLAMRKLIDLGWSEEEASKFSDAVKEAMDNAIVHGNLSLKKEDGDGDYYERIKAAQEENKAKKVKVWFRLSGEDATVQVKDEGAYVPNEIEDPTQADRLLKGSGRGMAMIFAGADNIEFAPGEIIIHKRRKGDEDRIV
jgi:hypothetical protein